MSQFHRNDTYLKKPKQAFTLIAMALAAVLGIFLYWFTKWNPYIVWVITLSVITFLMYGYDKAQSKVDGQRVPEIVLHGLALAGGFLGGWVGRWVFHHKTNKPVFTVILVMSTVVQLGIAYFIFR